MNFVFQIAIENALLVALAAPLVWAVSRLLRRPALTHALCLILLIKLVTPPIYRPAISLPQTSVDTTATAIAVRLTDEPADRLQAPLDSKSPLYITDTIQSLATPETRAELRQIPQLPDHSVHGFKAFIPALQTTWIAGSIICLLIASGRIIRFSRGLRHAHRAPPELQSRVAHLSRHLGLRSAPTVHFIPGSLCPMLWAVGRSPRLLIPVALWGRLDVSERDSILLHELAHWRRRDHWVRWIELAATTIYWWNPVAWWARRELREAEEQCCDAWVLHATGDFKPYANALLRAVEFISAPITSSQPHTPLPALASGMGQFNHLKRRIVMLKDASVSRALSPRTWVATLGFSAVLLPLSPSLKGEPQSPPTAQNTLSIIAVDEGAKDHPPTTAYNIILDGKPDDSSSAEDQLNAARKEIQDLRQRLAQTEARLALLKAQEQGTAAQNDQSATPANKNQNRIWKVEPDRTDSGATLRVDGKVVRVEGDAVRVERAPEAPGVHDGKYRVVVTDEQTGRIKEIREVPLPANPAQQADRLDKLEAQLRDLLAEIRSIRQQTSHVTPDNPARK